KHLLHKQLRVGVTKQFGHKRIGIEDFAIPRVDQQHAILRRFEKPPVASFRAPHLPLELQLLSHVLDAQKDPAGTAAGIFEPSSIKYHGATPDAFKLVGHLEVIEKAVAGKNVLQPFAQSRD